LKHDSGVWRISSMLQDAWVERIGDKILRG
jgi:hypothetical protein